VFYVYDAFGQLAAEYSSAAKTTNPACGTCYLTTDHLGSTRLITDAEANVIARHDFLPFGEEIPAGTAGRDGMFGLNASVNQKFTGKERDNETGLDYFGARYYGSALGRFVSPDPGNAGASLTDPQSWNGYSYVRNSPLTLVDPSGMQTNCATTVSISCNGDQSPNLAEAESRYQTLISGLPDPAFPQQAQQHQEESIWVHCGGSVSDFDCSPYPWSEHLLAAGWQPYFSSPIGALFRGNRQLWSNTAIVGNVAAVATVTIAAAPILADAASSLTLARLAVGPGRPWGIHFAVGVGGTWLHWMPDAMDEFGNFSAQITTQWAEAWAAKMAWFQIPVPILNPAGVLGTIGKPASNCLTGACYAIGQGWIP
jgi:RHS repeat-associated protein